MKCWCGSETVDSFRADYKQCTSCGSFVSIKQTDSNFYSFDYYWHTRQVEEYSFPPIEQRALDDFSNRIPFWGDLLFSNISDVDSVLEIGGCHGGFLHYCEEHKLKRCLGIEISEETCEFARKTFNVDMLCGTFPDVDIDERFDVVCGFDVLEHFPKPLDALLKMKSLGNYVMIQTPCYNGEGGRFTHFNEGEHLFVFTDKALRLLFSKVGLSIVYIGPAYYPQDVIIIGKSI